MRKKLLLDLAEFLETKQFVKLGGEFSMDTFGQFELAAEPVRNNATGTICHPCKTTACALGWAPAVPSIAKAGLSRQESRLPKEPGEVGYPDFTVNGEVIDDDIEAGSMVFGIGRDQSYWLFMPSTGRSYDKISAKTQAKRIRRFVEANGNLDKLGNF
jgi:hypothetical protein